VSFSCVLCFKILHVLSYNLFSCPPGAAFRALAYNGAESVKERGRAGCVGLAPASRPEVSPKGDLDAAPLSLHGEATPDGLQNFLFLVVACYKDTNPVGL